MNLAQFQHFHSKKQIGAEEWRALHIKFMALAHEEQGLQAVITKGALLSEMKQLLRASWRYVYVKGAEGRESETPEAQRISLLVAPPHGRWQYWGGVNEDFLQRVRLCIATAGQALSYPSDTSDREEIWLDCLYCDLLENDRDQLFAASVEGGTIVSVCVASATFCSRLEKLRIIGLETPAESFGTTARKVEPPTIQKSEKTTQIPKSREEILRPILEARGFSIHDWAAKAGVDFHTADEYLKGKTNPYPSTLKKLAEALGIEVAKLPK